MSLIPTMYKICKFVPHRFCLIWGFTAEQLILHFPTTLHLRFFLGTNNLKNALIACSGEKPYACAVCPRAFNQRVVLREHVRSHHSAPDRRSNGTVIYYLLFYCTLNTWKKDIGHNSKPTTISYNSIILSLYRNVVPWRLKSILIIIELSSLSPGFFSTMTFKLHNGYFHCRGETWLRYENFGENIEIL